MDKKLIIPLNIPMEKQKQKHFQNVQERNIPDLVEAFFGWV